MERSQQHFKIATIESIAPAKILFLLYCQPGHLVFPIAFDFLCLMPLAGPRTPLASTYKSELHQAHLLATDMIREY